MINLCSIIYIFGIILYTDTYLKMVIIHFYFTLWIYVYRWYIIFLLYITDIHLYYVQYVNIHRIHIKV